MAEIKVEKKNRPVWPWVVGILLLAAIIWIVADDDNLEPENEITATEPVIEQDMDGDTMQADARGSAMAYVNFIEENGEKITTDHEYSRQALTYLSRALDNVANENNVSVEDREKLNELREKADQLVQNQTSTEHADILDKAFTDAAEIIEKLQQEKFPELRREAEEVKNAADRVRPNVVVTNQKEAVKNFFERSADAIQSMANNGSRKEDV